MTIKLTDLDPRWVRHGGEGVSNADGSPIPERNKIGVSFDCPCNKCGQRAFLGFSNPEDGEGPVNGIGPHWEHTGTTFEDLTLRPSILRKSGCNWHGFLTNGELKSV